MNNLLQIRDDIPLAEKLSQARCLILNADYLPINYLPLSTLSWKDAITNVMYGKAFVIESYDDVVIHSAHDSFVVPSVIVGNQFKKPRHRIEFSKSNVFLRDDYQCQYCGRHFRPEHLTYDHWIPRSEGGKTTWDNILTACSPCNNRKGTQNKKRWKPRNKPVRPTYQDLVQKVKTRPLIIPDESWVQYLRWNGRMKVHNWIDNYFVE